MEFGLAEEAVGQLTMREYYALWDSLRAKEKRQQAVAIQQMGHLIAMVANTGMVRWDEPRKPEEFMPAAFFPRKEKREETQEEICDRIRGQMDQLGRIGKMYG